MSFDRFGLQPALLEAVQKAGFTAPTPIQEQAIPPALEGRDVLASAKTGSGKTAAFLLPILERLLATKSRRATRALIVTPTRELAAQIHEQFRLFAGRARLTAATVYGGVGMGPQTEAFKRGVDVIVATPGRLLDHLAYPWGKLDKVEMLVLDEADRMLDMGFLPDVKRILEHLPTERQTLFFSATMPPPIAELTRTLLKDPVTVAIGSRSAPAEGVTHSVFSTSHDAKSSLLVDLYRRRTMDRTLVFTRTRHRADRLARYLVQSGIEAVSIHGGHSQGQRDRALAGFKSGRHPVLVATDVAARGIDVDEISHVVNFDVPHVAEDYIHRVGRTARAEAKGDAYTFVSAEEEADMRAIEKAIGMRLPRQHVLRAGGTSLIVKAPPPPKNQPAPRAHGDASSKRRARPRGRGGRNASAASAAAPPQRAERPRANAWGISRRSR